MVQDDLFTMFQRAWYPAVGCECAWIAQEWKIESGKAVVSVVWRWKIKIVEKISAGKTVMPKSAADFNLLVVFVVEQTPSL